jgi:hypothetical protein
MGTNKQNIRGNIMKPVISEIAESITVKGIVDEDFVNYKVPSMTITFPYCDFKCEVDRSDYCHNSSLVNEPDIKVSVANIYKRYISNPISEAIVCQGLEPFDSWEELNGLLFHFRIHESCLDTFVIYTGYTKKEIEDKVNYIQKMYSNVIIKFGRFIPNNKKHFDNVIGVMLSSDNQYAEKIS